MSLRRAKRRCGICSGANRQEQDSDGSEWYSDGFWSPSRRLIVEVDGGYHRDPEKQAADANRDRVLGSKLGAKTMRFSVDDVLFRPADVHLEIALEVANRPVFRNWNEGLGS
jgi:very-short-patch-repair endonuclease